MHQNLEMADNLKPHISNDSYSISSRPWWRGVQHDAISLGALVENTTNASQLKHLNCSLETTVGKAEDTGRQDMGTDANKEMQVTVVSQAENGKCEEHLQSLHPTTVVPPSMGEYLTSPSQLELAGHSVAHATHPYSGPCYGDVMLAYRPHALVHPHCFGAHGNRMALPLEMAEEPVYVNAKQYHGILRRRQSRAKAELEKKLIKVRKPYLHESRHLHAMRRARGCGGRFLNTKKAAADGASDKGAANSAESVSTHSSTSPNPSTHHDLMKSYEKEMKRQQSYSNGNSLYPQHPGFQMSRYNLMSDKRGEGDFLGKRRHRALTIQ